MKAKIHNCFIVQRFFTLAVLLLLMGFSINGLAQNPQKLNVTVSLKIKDGDMKNALVTITMRNEPYKVLDPTKGEEVVDLPLGYEYEFKFTKLGYATKSIIIDTHVPEHREERAFKKQHFKVELEKEPNGGQSNVKLAYNMKIADFDFYQGKFSDDAAQKNVKENTGSNTSNTSKNNTNTTKELSNGVKVNDSAKVNTAIKQPKNPNIKIKDKKVTQMDTKKITIITINSYGIDYIYKKEEFGWGGTFYYKNDISITESTFVSETE